MSLDVDVSISRYSRCEDPHHQHAGRGTFRDDGAHVSLDATDVRFRATGDGDSGWDAEYAAEFAALGLGRPGRRPRPVLDRFWGKVDKVNGPVHPTLGRCWVWTGYLKKKGYGYFSISSSEHAMAHRFAYELIHGPVPDGLQCDHLCRVRRCVRPDHLEAVIPAENTRRGTRWPVARPLAGGSK